MADEAGGNHIRSRAIDSRPLTSGMDVASASGGRGGGAPAPDRDADLLEPVRLQVLTGTVQIGCSSFTADGSALDHRTIVIRWVERATPSNARETK